jgi:hypothetical protein
LDPRQAGPPKDDWPGGSKPYPDGSLFTTRDQCTNTYVFGEMMDEPMNIYWLRSDRPQFDRKSSPYRIANAKEHPAWLNSTYIITSSPGNCWETIGSDAGASGPYGDNTNALGVLQNWKDDTNNPHGTHYFKLFAQALGTVMCGPENIDKAKVGLYSIEFLPLNWFTQAI